MAFDFKEVRAVMRTTLTFPPAVTGWNRLEGRPRTEDFERALCAEARDALWFLARQWQFGEFQGEDAGSPVEARTAVRVDPIQHYACAGQSAVAYDPALPLETHVERERVGFDLALHAEATRYFFRLLTGLPKPNELRAHYLGRYPLSAAKIEGFADSDTRRALSAAAARVLDIATLLDDAETASHDLWVGTLAGLGDGDRAALKQRRLDLGTWFRRLYSQPAGALDDAWNARFLEYQFRVATDTAERGQTVLVADEYTQGHLDWFAFDFAPPGTRLVRRADQPEVTPSTSSFTPLSFIPTPVSFAGMPSHRYWEMESRQVEFAELDVHTTDLAKLLLTEFVLVYANDWCVIPYELEVGSLSDVSGVLVTDDFGEQSLLLPAGRGLDDAWQRWSMFGMNRVGEGGAADTRFFLPPSLTKVIEAAPLEKVQFLRDEMANMVWAVERIVPTGLGATLSGYEVAPLPPATIPAPHPTAQVRYELGSDVPNNWIPFIPVHIPNQSRSIQLQRARLPGPQRRFHTRILGPKAPYYVNEEEVPRAGKLVTRGFQRVRWLGGGTATWIGRRVATGRGEGSSGLAFDRVLPVERPRGP